MDISRRGIPANLRHLTDDREANAMQVFLNWHRQALCRLLNRTSSLVLDRVLILMDKHVRNCRIATFMVLFHWTHPVALC
jgi:hypothetical protein